jgi:DNA-directed RNA polymerase subunit RPC12/RpoP
MAQMATTPVYKCRKCGTPVAVTMLSSGAHDNDGSRLVSHMQNLHKIILCSECRRAYNYFAQQNRTNEFWLNPHAVILAVKDDSGLDYYRRKG